MKSTITMLLVLMASVAFSQNTILASAKGNGLVQSSIGETLYNDNTMSMIIALDNREVTIKIYDTEIHYNIETVNKDNTYFRCKTDDGEQNIEITITGNNAMIFTESLTYTIYLNQKKAILEGIACKE
jgi:hypothetical protein